VKNSGNLNQDTAVSQEHPTKRDNTTNPGIQAPQHHYHTRSLAHCLEQRQDTSTAPNAGTNNSKGMILPQQAAVASSTTSTTPTTRLRYQQQLAAQAGSANANLQCDLDLDQIEND
jgi:hypothetical protein